MLSGIKFIFRKLLHFNEPDNGGERAILPIKRTRDFSVSDDTISSKRRCVEAGSSSAATVVEENLPRKLPATQSFIRPMAGSRRPGLFTIPRRSVYLNPDMLSKDAAASYASARNPSCGKENGVYDVSDDDDDEGQQHRLETSKNSGRESPWVNVPPKHNPISQTFQRINYNANSMAVKGESLRSTSGAVPKWNTQQSGVRTSKLQSRHISPRIQRQKRTDNKVYGSLTPSTKRGIDETIRLDERHRYSKLLQQYECHSLPINKTDSSEACNYTQRYTGGVQRRPLISFVKLKTPDVIEVVDLTLKEQVARIRRDQEVKPLKTLATMIANKEMASVSKPIAQVTQDNSMEQFLKNNPYLKNTFLSNTTKKFDQRKRETQKDLEESRYIADQYAKKNEKDMKQIEERVRRHMKITEADIVLDDIFEEPVPELPVLDGRMQKAIDSALHPNPPNETLVDGFSLKITRRDIHTLSNLNWLNDEIINFYMNLLIERGKLDKYPSVYAFNTFFYSKLVSGGHGVLKRWTRKIDVFSYDLIIVPVHLGVHWCMAAIDFREKAIRYYDSMGNPNHKCLQALVKYLEEESLDKKKVAYDTSTWSRVNMKDIPQQMNGSDCGVFACMYAEYISRNAKITFTQTNMPYFRRKMVYEILSVKLLVS